MKVPPAGWSSLVSHVLERTFQLPRPETRDINVRRDVAVPMDDGAILLADHYAPVLWSSGHRHLPSSWYAVHTGGGASSLWSTAG